ncbi:MAG: hypothetical protein ACK4WC_06220 [Rubrimonas sp.]
MRAILLVAMAVAAAPLAAQSSHCAGLPATAQVEVRGPDNVIPATLGVRGFTCPRGFTEEMVGPVTRCRQPGQLRLETREPRAACYAALGVTAPRGAIAQQRPTAQCPGTRQIVSIFEVRGRNAGWNDVTLTAPRGTAVTLQHLNQSGGRVPRNEDPRRNDCFPHDCRLVRMTATADTPATMQLTLATPGGGAEAAVTVTTEAVCPGR